MIDLHGDLAGILTIANGGLPGANGNAPRAGAKGGKGQTMLDEGALSSVMDWAKGKVVAGAHNALSHLFNDYDIKSTTYPVSRQ